MHEGTRRQMLAAKARRARALTRPELRGFSDVPRVAAAGPTSAAVKVGDAALRDEVEAFLERKRKGGT